MALIPRTLWVIVLGLAACGSTTGAGGDVPADTTGRPDTTEPADTLALGDSPPSDASRRDSADGADTVADTAAAPSGRVALRARRVAGDSGTLLVSNGVPFPKGALRDVAGLRLRDEATEIATHLAPLARWPDGSLRAVLLQFERDAARFPADLSLEWGAASSVARRQPTPVDWDLPQAVAFPPAEVLCASGVVGPLVAAGADDQLRDYDANQAAGYAALVGSDGWGSDARVDGYYSTTLNWYLHFARTGDVAVFEWARREAIHYRDDQIVHDGPDAGTMNGRSEPRYLFLRAMEADYLLTGDPETLRVAGLMADYLLRALSVEWFFYGADDERFWTERRVAFTLLGLVVYGRMSGDARYLNAAKPRFDNILATQAEWDDGGWIHHLYAHDSEECGTVGAYGGSPFMTGLLFEALLAYHDQFGDERVVSSVVAAVDWLYEAGWYGAGFSYLIGCGYGADDAAPDLNLLIVAGFGFAYQATGEERHRTRGWEIFDAGVDEAYLGARKQFNQNYRSSGAFPWYAASGRE